MNDLSIWLFALATDPWLLLLLFIGMAVEHDPFQQIVNVQWDEGLAVEFYPKDT
jgi:hypothetical protein